MAKNTKRQQKFENLRRICLKSFLVVSIFMMKIWICLPTLNKEKNPAMSYLDLHTSLGVKYASLAPEDAQTAAPELKNDQSEPVEEPKEPKLIVAYLSGGSKYRVRRDSVRKECFPTYEKIGLQSLFFIGRPSQDMKGAISKAQGQKATEAEIADASALLDEAKEHNDIVMVPERDHYRDTTDKVLFMLRYGYDHGGDFIAKVDDDMCLNVDELRKLIKSREGNPNDLYAGLNGYEWGGTEYESMKGPHGEISKFMPGAYLLSRGAMKKIAIDNNVHSVLYAFYGTSSEDANVGKWLDYAMEKDPSFHADRVVTKIAHGIDVPQPDKNRRLKAVDYS